MPAVCWQLQQYTHSAAAVYFLEVTQTIIVAAAAAELSASYARSSSRT
jgi:hypothetical protein